MPRSIILSTPEIFSEVALLILASLPDSVLTRMNLPPAVMSAIWKIQSEEDDYIGTGFALYAFLVSTKSTLTVSDKVVVRNIASALFVALNNGGPCDKSALDMSDVLKDESWTRKLITAIPEGLRFTSNKKYTKVGGIAEECYRIAEYISSYDSDAELAQDLLPDMGETGDDERATGRGFIANTVSGATDALKDILNVE